MKCKNVSGKVKYFKLGNKWKSVEPGDEVELPAGVAGVEAGLEELVEKAQAAKEKNKVPEPPKKKEPKKPEKNLKAKNFPTKYYWKQKHNN